MSTPYSNISTTINNNDIDNAIERCGLNWEVEKEDVFFSDGNKIPNYKVLRRSDLERSDVDSALGMVTDRYEPLQNREAFDWFKPFLESGQVDLDSGGLLDAGKKIWLLAKFRSDPIQITPQDRIGKYLIISNAHDGKHATTFNLMPTRLSCTNMLPGIAQSGFWRSFHSSNSSFSLERARKVIELAESSFHDSAEKMKMLTKKRYDNDSLKEYVYKLLDVKDPEHVTTRSYNVSEKILSYVEKDDSNNISVIAGTWWAAYNGYNQYLNYSASRTDNNRMKNLWFGTAKSKNVSAFNLAAEYASK